MVYFFEDECEGCEEDVEHAVHYCYVCTHGGHNRGQEEHFHGPDQGAFPELVAG